MINTKFEYDMRKEGIKIDNNRSRLINIKWLQFANRYIILKIVNKCILQFWDIGAACCSRVTTRIQFSHPIFISWKRITIPCVHSLEYERLYYNGDVRIIQDQK